MGMLSEAIHFINYLADIGDFDQCHVAECVIVEVVSENS